MLLEKILLKIVEKRFSYDKEFYSYRSFKSTPASWSRFKNGEVSIKDMKWSKVNSMLSVIFTPLEVQIIEKVQFEKNSNWIKKDEIERYRDIKIELLKEWLTSENTYCSLSRYPLPNGGKSANYLSVEKDEYSRITFTIIGSSNIPAGKKQRAKWLLNNLDSLEY